MGKALSLAHELISFSGLLKPMIYWRNLHSTAGYSVFA